MRKAPQLKVLEEIILSYESALVAFSGGADSTLVLKLCRDLLGKERVKAVTAQSPSIPESELESAKQLADRLDVHHTIIRTCELDNQDYSSNSPRRCFFCKQELFKQLVSLADHWQLAVVCEGSNRDDLNDYRPGFEAVRNYSVRSPLVEVGLTKQDVRNLSRQMGLVTWDKPASPCLSSRIPYGQRITAEKLRQIERGEMRLRDLGFRIVRLRHFGNLARLEIDHSEIGRLADETLKNEIINFVRSLGFDQVLFESYRSGNLNAEISSKIKMS